MDLHDKINWSSQKLEADNQIPLSEYYCLADELLKRALIFEEQEKLVDLSIILLEFLRLCSEIIPYHKDYEADPCEQEIIEKVMLSTGQLSLDPRMQYRRIALRNAYEDLLAFLKLKRKDQGQAVSYDFAPEHPEHNDHFDHMSLLPLVPCEELPDQLAAATTLPTQPSAPPIPDSHFPSLVADSATAGTKANLLANYEVHGEQVDYRERGLVDKVYVPWLEEVCQKHPSLIECQRKRTPKYAGWAFTSLGRVLHFLEITKVEEMNEEACECLQLLWDEVQAFGFDLSWLAPQVEFALNMKSYMEKVRKVNKLEEEKRSLELRIQQLSMKLVETEKDIETSRGDLTKSWEDLGEQVDSERLLGYRWHPAPDVVILWKSMTLWKV